MHTLQAKLKLLMHIKKSLLWQNKSVQEKYELHWKHWIHSDLVSEFDEDEDNTISHLFPAWLNVYENV